jgi:hypothetical protein
MQMAPISESRGGRGFCIFSGKRKAARGRRDAKVETDQQHGYCTLHNAYRQPLGGRKSKGATVYQYNPHSQTWCAHCAVSCGPAWQRVGDGEYVILCRDCQVERDRQFTPENALIHALIICGLPGRLNVERGQR